MKIYELMNNGVIKERYRKLTDAKNRLEDLRIAGIFWRRRD